MLTDIFSSFDPSTISIYNWAPSPIFWFMNFLIMLMLSSMFWLAPSRLHQISSFPKSIMFEQAARTFGKNMKGFAPILSSLFTLIILVNLSGLLPYVFSTSSHLFFTFSLAIPLWLAMIMSSVTNSPTDFLAGILPGGAPSWLNPFLVLIETTSISVRPITLSFRLAANMSAGHIVLGLIGIYSASALFTSTISSISLLSIQILYILFEMGICLIQAYIFCLLLSLYSDDHTSL
uniref:ATP synthase subunit a n=1 Tax=Terebellides stroemii TaxID=1037239 RepID=B3TJX2_9ANNE|nr:ATP synthase F0 subunit 6 [Terebellides stroemii]ABW76478.1 ATP synthase F0 subunit 6 [Terebellides stroemii]